MRGETEEISSLSGICGFEWKVTEGEAATQPVAGATFKIESITLDYDTVLSAEDFDLTNYVNVRWTATKNGKSETIGTGLSCKIEDNDKTKGAAIGVMVTYKEGSGIYGSATGGGNNAPLAVAERVYGEDRYDTAIQVTEELRETLSGKRFKAVVVADGRDFTDALSASGDEFADALTGGALAAINDKPLLLVNEYNTVEAGKIVNGNGYAMTVIGGTGAVSAKTVQDVYNTKIA